MARPLICCVLRLIPRPGSSKRWRQGPKQALYTLSPEEEQSATAGGLGVSTIMETSASGRETDLGSPAAVLCCGEAIREALWRPSRKSHKSQPS